MSDEDKTSYSPKINSEYLNIIYPIVDKRESLYVAYSDYHVDLANRNTINNNAKYRVIKNLTCLFTYLEYYQKVKDIEKTNDHYSYAEAKHIIYEQSQPFSHEQIKKLFNFIRFAIFQSGIEDIERIKKDYSKNAGVKGESRY